jgi:YHS domain-containing protein
MPDATDLKTRLSAEFAQAKDRVRAMQQTAEDRHHQLQVRYQNFLRISKTIRDRLLPRVEDFSRAFPMARRSINTLEHAPGEGGLAGAFLTFEFPETDECPASITLKLSLVHDTTIDHLVLAYDLEMVPVFIPFKAHEELIQPLDAVDEEKVVAWFDDRAVQFTRTFFEMQFNPQYQKRSLADDVVLRVTFPLAFAAGKEVHDGTTYYFFTEDSLKAFARDPSQYLNKREAQEPVRVPV